jgi:DNA-binding transcriptional LysR family regulator
VQLFRRKPRGVELTQAGEALLAEARAILDRVEHAVVAARRTARGDAGRIGLGFTSSASFHPFVPRIIREFREASPLVALTLEEAGTGELVDGLRAERIDAAFVRSPIGAVAELAIHSVLEEEMVAALPAGHQLAGGTTAARLPLAALESETFILYRRPLGPGLYDAIIAVTLIPASMRRMGIEGVAYRPLDRKAGLIAPLNLACRRGESAPAVRRFIALVRRTAP